MNILSTIFKVKIKIEYLPKLLQAKLLFHVDPLPENMMEMLNKGFN